MLIPLRLSKIRYNPRFPEKRLTSSIPYRYYSEVAMPEWLHSSICSFLFSFCSLTSFSYNFPNPPIWFLLCIKQLSHFTPKNNKMQDALTSPTRFERATFRLGGERSIQLSYEDFYIIRQGN